MSDNLQVEIYTAFLEKATLKNIDREVLKSKRGFTDLTIDKFKFVSGGEQNRKIITDLREKYDDQVLFKFGLLEEINKTLVPCKQLLDNRIIIPYLDEEGNATLLRPHKLGLKNVPIQPYCRLMLKDKPEHIILTEGEFKATALAQWGIPGFAIPGISSFGGKHFEQLVEFLKKFKVKKITIIYDNEVKDNPLYKDKYKEKPEDRWDTPYWACIMQTQLRKSGFDMKIGVLPDEWRDNGKIDFDGALAKGKTSKDILAVRDNGYTQTSFLHELPEEAEKIVRRKLAMYFAQSPIKREYNKYMFDTGAPDKLPKRLSNFIINIKSSFFTSEGVMRHVEFVNEYGERSDTFVLEPPDMSGVNQFKQFCFSKGGYVWRGSGSELQDVWEYELRRDTGDMIYIPEQIGEVEPGFWLFGNIAIRNGKTYTADEDGIFWIDSKGYKPQSLQVDARGNPTEDSLPALYLDNDIDIKEIAINLKSSVGGYEAYIGIGWVIATIFSRVIFDEFKIFPFIFPHGKRESGKSTFMRWIMAFFGMETEGIGLKETSQNYIMRALSYYSSLGVWFDEYRNISDVVKKDGYLRSAYNRQLSGKGIKSAFGARSYNVNGTLAISGEEMPKDSALYTRCVPLQMSSNRRERERYDWLNRMSERFSGITFNLIKNYDRYKDELMMNIKDLKATLVEQDITDRTAENWAIVSGCYYTLVEKDKEFIKWVLGACKEVKQTAEDEHMLNVFWSDVLIMHSDRIITNKHIKLQFEGDNDKCIMIWFPAIYNLWSSYYRKRSGDEPFDKASIIAYIKDEPYFISERTVRLDNKIRLCYVIDPKNGSTLLKQLADSVGEDEATYYKDSD